jgi:hypothetical protein
MNPQQKRQRRQRMAVKSGSDLDTFDVRERQSGACICRCSNQPKKSTYIEGQYESSRSMKQFPPTPGSS